MNNRKLKESNDIDLVNLIKSNNKTEKCLSILIDRHSALCVDIINRYMSKSSNHSLRQEMINEKDYQIYQSALKYDESKGAKFSTYLGNEIKWKCLNAFNKFARNKSIPVEEDLINYFSANAQQNDSRDDVFGLIIDKASKHPDVRVGRIFNLRYIVGKNNSVMPWKNISENLGMSIQGCINIHNSAIKNIKHKIRKEINE